MSLTELSRQSGLPKSTTLRLGRKLVDLGVLTRAGNGDFVIGLRLWEIASLAAGFQELRAVAMPFMEELNRRAGQHVLLAVRDGHEALLLERHSARLASPVLYRIGGRLPLHSTGVGLTLLAFADLDFQREYLDLDWQIEPEGRVVRSTQLRRRLAEARRTGCATAFRRAPGPLLSIAAPIWQDATTLAGALSIVVPVHGAEPGPLMVMVRAAAQAVSGDLRTANRAGVHHLT